MPSRAGPLPILILSDNRPGHYHLSEGVVAAIARRRPVSVTRREVRRPRWLPGRAMAGLVASSGGRLLLGRLLGLEHDLPEAGLVVSAGGDTVAANVAVAHRLAVPNIYCGTLRRIAPERFALVVSSYARHASLPRHVVALKPSGFDPDALGRPKPRISGAAPRTAGLLVGGDSGLFRYTDAEWRRLVDFVAESRRHEGITWIVSTSRRSPAPVADALARLAATPGGAIRELIDFRTAGPGTLPRLFAGVDAVLCTEDSSTMLSEAVCARLPVVGITPADHAFKDEEGEYRAFMRGEGWYRSIPLAELTPPRFVAELSLVRPLESNHLDRLANLVAERLPELFR